ncbi:transcription factor IIA subunit alpha [Parahypoxylon ruwenzoriense]
MSNTQVGAVYQQIITDVIEASRVDFEEGGVEESVLEELRKGWQKKLSQQGQASFPWDPKIDPTPAPPAAVPQPTPAPEPTPQAPINGASYNQAQIPQAPGLTMPMPDVQPLSEPAVKPEPGVKIEPGLENTSMITQVPQQNNQAVQQRVIQQLQSQYGERAAASINKLKEQPTNGAQPHSQQRPANQATPQNYQYQGQPQHQYRPSAPPNAQQQRAGMPNGQRPAQSQVDGADDSENRVGVLLRRGPAGDVEMGRFEIDKLLHAQIAANARAMEGGGLMLPLKLADKGKAASRRRTPANGDPSQFDGADDDMKEESDDENAINSDLDDPDDNLEEEDEDEDSGQIMLCMYDKVQRVKNKWKCVLKDGVLSVNGRDWVFHKATGEYEW